MKPFLINMEKTYNDNENCVSALPTEMEGNKQEPVIDAAMKMIKWVVKVFHKLYI
jgi:hypothetical protein